MRTFDTGATRDDETSKLDFEGFLSPAALAAFAAYMHKHRVQADGALRDSDNWQRGIPLTAYMKSAWRHFFEWWRLHRLHVAGATVPQAEIRDALCALLFNTMGYLHSIEVDNHDHGT